jgi:hypothetical protein
VHLGWAFVVFPAIGGGCAVRLEPADIADLQPVIAAAVRATLEQIHAEDATLDGERIGYPEAEAAALIGVRSHVLRDARLRGEINGRLVGKKIVYARSELLRFLGAAK